MGWSLGGLSAFDIVWQNPQTFGKVGAFSGSFWWRTQNSPDDKFRIMHQIVNESPYKQGLKMWFMAGTKEETADRDKDGIIDVIDDTLDLIKTLEQKGYKQPHDISYQQIEGGQHNVPTWANQIPAFLEWAFAK